MEHLLAFIGFGEAAYHIANGLKSDGLSGMVAFDVCADDPQRGAFIHKRAQEAGAVLTASLKDAYASSRFIFSLTSAKVALSVAESVIPNLKDGQVFVDLNSAAPTVETAIDRIPRPKGVKFCDAAVMGTVPGNGHKVPMFLTGDGSRDFADTFSAYGMRLTVLDAPTGGSSAIKMLKSVVMKGLPQLMLESFEAAEQYGVLDTLVDSLKESLDGKGVEKLANTFVARTMIHAGRRGAEMRDVVSTLQALDVNADMSKAAAGKLEELARKNWTEKLGPDGGKMDYRSAIKLLVKESKSGKGELE